MKYLSLLLILVVLGCGSKSPYDVSADQVKQHRFKHGPVGGPGPGGPDLDHLPPGAVKHETAFKKGDKLPDGTVADHDGKIVRVEVNKAGGPDVEVNKAGPGGP